MKIWISFRQLNCLYLKLDNSDDYIGIWLGFNISNMERELRNCKCIVLPDNAVSVESTYLLRKILHKGGYIS